MGMGMGMGMVMGMGLVMVMVMVMGMVMTMAMMTVIAASMSMAMMIMVITHYIILCIDIATALNQYGQQGQFSSSHRQVQNRFSVNISHVSIGTVIQ